MADGFRDAMRAVGAPPFENIRRDGTTVGDLERVASRDVVVRHFLKAWRSGYYPTFEQCLVALACELSEQAERYRGNAVAVAQRTSFVTLPDGMMFAAVMEPNKPIGTAGEKRADGTIPIELNEYGKSLYGANTKLFVIAGPDGPLVVEDKSRE